MTNFKSDVKRIEVPVASGKKLVAETFPNDAFDEIVIFLQGEDGECQDIAVVNQRYNLSDGGIIPLPGKYAVKVFSDCNSEDYTHEFLVDEYSED